MRYILFLLICFYSLSSAQKIKVVDEENGKPIAVARIISGDRVVYTNDDGFALVDESDKNFEISAIGFKKVTFQSFRAVVKLKRHYNEIKEVTIIPVDFKSIFKDVLKNYHKRYYSKPSLYDVVIKQKNFDNNKLHLMVVSEAKLWSRNNSHNLDYNGYINSELQMQLNNVKYLKRNTSDSIFLGNTNEFTNPYTNDIFLNYELKRVMTHFKKGKAKYSADVVYEEDGEKLIFFRIKSIGGSIIEGKFKYNTAKKVITYYQVLYLLEDIPAQQKISKERVIFMQKYGNALITYDFIEKNGKYIPSFSRFDVDNYQMFYQNKSHTKKMTREIILNQFSESDRKGLDPKVDFRKNIWENIPVKDSRENSILLSEEEQEFVSEK
ncbi:hypothetical protein [Chryseobacterium sp.]|uniref:hypothetical protein n=1 Tax=Chryseobacterium sp. TaxID=1871047 RepID=UPI00289DA723|nr:hypothetical protein [Chryseobacterium sp.]